MKFAGFARRFADVVANWWAIMKRRKKLTWFTLRLWPDRDHFSDWSSRRRAISPAAIQLGGLMQIDSAFGQVQDALSWFVTAYASSPIGKRPSTV